MRRAAEERSPKLAPRNLAVSLPLFEFGTEFFRQRQTRQKGSEDGVSAQRPEIGDHHTREMAAKTAFLLVLLRVSEDWVVRLQGSNLGPAD
jgi:hypothetical protein